jgi:hypothetical protein
MCYVHTHDERLIACNDTCIICSRINKYTAGSIEIFEVDFEKNQKNVKKCFQKNLDYIVLFCMIEKGSKTIFFRKQKMK